MTKKREFIEFIEGIFSADPELEVNMPDNVKAYWEIFKGKDEDSKPLFTENGKLILQYMRDNLTVPMFKSRDIAEGLFISSRVVSGSIRKLVSDGFVEKVSQDPVVYALTDNGKTIEIV